MLELLLVNFYNDFLFCLVYDQRICWLTSWFRPLQDWRNSVADVGRHQFGTSFKAVHSSGGRTL